ncbi:hypothetical protein M405DRAFT_877115 [Rhizopogon salebrosus TDB-379]|nr:hypothetical protein M405DRAFT_877115 [Rhizopogon salebrosus TDB-379]
MKGQGEITRGMPPRSAREKPRGEYHHGGPGRNHEGSATMEGQGETTRGVPPWRAREKPRGEDHHGGPGRNHEGRTTTEGQGEKPRREDKFEGKSKRAKFKIWWYMCSGKQVER